MKKRTLTLALALVLAFASQTAFAATVNKTVDTSAEVDGTLSMSVLLFKNDIDGTDITATNKMDFGKLVDIGTGTLRSSATSTTGTGAVLAYITVNSHGIQWTLKQNGSAMTSGANSLEADSLAVTPVYIDSDNANVADNGTIGTASTWVNSNKTLYTSHSSGPLRTIRAYYSVTDDSAAGASAPNIGLDKPAGIYTGNIIFTATA